MACNLNWSPRHNWVEDCGGLGDLANVACHMLEKGVPREKAIPAAINFAKHVCATDQSKNFTISNPTHHVAGWKQARWCAAVAHWEKLKACARAKRGGKALDGDVAALQAEVDAIDLAELGVLPAPAAVVEAAGFKAVFDENASVEELENGDLLIRGLASDTGLDRDDESFEPDAFDRGLKAFLEVNPLLAYHHDPSKALGRVRKLWRSARGLEMEAIVKKPVPGSWAEDVYSKVRAGVIRGLSVGGRFKRRMTARGPRIFDVDLQEISVTPLPVNPRTMFAVAAEGKAVDGEPLRWEPANVEEVEATLAGLKAVFGAIEHALELREAA